MKALKSLFLFLLVVALLGAAVYLPLRYHVVTFQSKRHLISKDALGYNDTFLNLDKTRSKWKKVIKSPSLRAYFTKFYSKELQKELSKHSNSLWKQLKVHGRKTFRILKKGAKDLTKKAVKELKKLDED
jgi:hypothetical protein